MNTEAIVQIADIYAAHAGLRRSTVSTYAANDGKLLDRLNAGSSCTLRRADQLLTWFSERWPADLEWPRNIPRPKSKEAANA